MQSLTKQIVEEELFRLKEKREKEIRSFVAIRNQNGSLGNGGSTKLYVENFGKDFIRPVLDALFKCEADCFAHSKDHIPDTYYEELSKEIDQLIEYEIGCVQSNALNLFKRYPSFDKLVIGFASDVITKEKESARRRINIMKEKNIRGMLRPAASVININSSVVATLNAGVVYGNVSGKIELVGNPELADVFKKTLDALQESQLSEKDRIANMQYVQFLAEEFQKEKESRNYQMISLALQALSVISDSVQRISPYLPLISNAFGIS